MLNLLRLHYFYLSMKSNLFYWSWKKLSLSSYWPVWLRNHKCNINEVISLSWRGVEGEDSWKYISRKLRSTKKCYVHNYFLNDILLTFSQIYERNTTKIAIITKTMIFHVLSRNRAVTPKKKLKENTRVSIWFLENQISWSLWCRCVKSPERGLFFLIIRLTITYTASTAYIPNTASTVAIFPQEIIARVASINPKNIVPESHINIFSL